MNLHASCTACTLTARRGHAPQGPCPWEHLEFAEYRRPHLKIHVARTRVTRVGLANDIRGKGADGGDGDVVYGLGSEARHGGISLGGNGEGLRLRA